MPIYRLLTRELRSLGVWGGETEVGRGAGSGTPISGHAVNKSVLDAAPSETVEQIQLRFNAGYVREVGCWCGRWGEKTPIAGGGHPLGATLWGEL